MCMESRLAEIIEYLGGTTAVANGLGHRWPTTVQGWKKRGRADTDRINQLVTLAAKFNKPLTHADFFAPVGSPIGRIAA